MNHLSMKFVTGISVFALVAATQSSASAAPIAQWATGAEATSVYNTNQYAATEATGAPNATACDGENIWASLAGDTVDSLTLSYATAVIPTTINVYQNGKQGAVSSVKVSTNGTTWTQVYTGDPTNAVNGSCLEANYYDDILAVRVTGIKVAIKYVRVTVDQSTAGYAEIDAVQLVGKQAQSIAGVAASLKVASTLKLPTKTNKKLAITWTSSTKSICTVKSGSLKAIKKGTCKISGTSAGNTSFAAVTLAQLVTVKK